MEEHAGHQAVINNDFYETLNEMWYTADDHPIALLRAENAVRTPWIAEKIAKKCTGMARVLDVGCGGGFLSNYLAQQGHAVTGIDLSSSSLKIATAHDSTQAVRYVCADAYNLPFEKESFDVVCAMDILEHVEEPKKLISEASRVLRKEGLFFFHTFNRNFFSYLLVIKGVDWFVKNAPKNMHVYHLFLSPTEVSAFCASEKMDVSELIGLAPKVQSRAFWKMLFTRKVPADFSFHFVKSLMTGYCGIAIKQ